MKGGKVHCKWRKKRQEDNYYFVYNKVGHTNKTCLREKKKNTSEWRQTILPSAVLLVGERERETIQIAYIDNKVTIQHSGRSYFVAFKKL